MANPLTGVRVKIDRAKKHLADLNSAIAAFEDRKPYSVVTDVETQPGYEAYRFCERETIPIEWSAILGDCIHNLRASLDLLAVALVVHNGATPYDYTAFPIGSSETHFRTSALPSRLKGASAAATKLVETLKPYKGGNETLYRLHRIDMADKHLLLIPVAAANTRFEIEIDVTNVTGHLHVPLAPRPARTIFPLKQGDELGSIKRTPNGEFQDNSKLNFGFEVAFGEGQIFDGDPVIPTLTQLLHLTERTVDIFARNIFGLAAW